MPDLPYTELAPPPDLAAYVDRFWMRRSTGALPHAHRILPDGCVDLLLDLDCGTARVVGTMTRALVIPARASNTVAARFRPGVAFALFAAPLAALTDHAVDAADLHVALAPLLDAAAHVAADVAVARIDRTGHGDGIVQGEVPHAVVAMLARWIRTRLAGTRPDRLVGSAVVRLMNHAPPSIAALADSLGVTRQHLARRFHAEVGVGPKDFARIARMQRAVAAIQCGRSEFARLAIEQGYADQSHLVHELRALVGLTPTQLRAAQPPPLPLAHLFVMRV